MFHYISQAEYEQLLDAYDSEGYWIGPKYWSGPVEFDQDGNAFCLQYKRDEITEEFPVFLGPRLPGGQYDLSCLPVSPLLFPFQVRHIEAKIDALKASIKQETLPPIISVRAYCRGTGDVVSVYRTQRWNRLRLKY